MLRSQRFYTTAFRRRSRIVALAAVVGVVLLPGVAARAQDETYVSSTRLPAMTLPGGAKITSFDISFVDPVIGVYLLADRTNKAVQAADTYTNTLFTPYVAVPPFAGVAHNPDGSVNNDKSGPDGVLTVNHREIWAGDGDSSIKVIDLFTGKTTHVIHTGGVNRADELCFDPRDQLVMIANDAEPIAAGPPATAPFVSIISTRSYSVLNKILMDGTNGTPKATNGIEQCQWDMRTGTFYVAIPENNGKGDDKAAGAVVEISSAGKVLHNWVVPIASCAGPQGMALGPVNQILLGCNDPNKTVKSTIIIHNSKGSGPVIVVPGEDGSDEVWYNEGSGEYFLALSGGATPQRLGIIDLTLDPGITDQSVKIGIPNTAATPHGTNHSVAVDPIFNQVYVPIASSSGSTICGTSGGLDVQGCIAVFTQQGPPDPPLSNGQ